MSLFYSMATMLGNPNVAFAVVMPTQPRAIPLAMITMRKSTHGFPFRSRDKYGAPLLIICRDHVRILVSKQLLRSTLIRTYVNFVLVSLSPSFSPCKKNPEFS